MVDTVVITSDTSSAPEGHDQKMIDLVDKANAGPQEDNLADPQASSESRPEWLPEKFKSPEDMAKAYSELESKLGGQKPPAPDATPGDDKAPDNTEANAALADKGLQLEEFSQEFAQKGELSPESYEKLQKAGFDKNLVNQYIEGQRALVNQYESTVKAEVGGDEQFSEMTTWAKANMTPGEIDAFNRAVSSGNVDQAKMAVRGLQAQYSKAVGSDPQRLLGGGKGSAGEDVFESTAQVTKAMSDPQYKNDPAFRAKVQAKLARSKVF